MTEIALPVLGTGIIVGVVLPAAAVAARGALWALDRVGTPRLAGQDAVRYLLLLGPTVAPVAWLLSACLRQAAVGTAAEVCALPDPPGTVCPEVAALGGLLVAFVVGTALIRLRRAAGAPRRAAPTRSAATRRRLQRIADYSHPDLRPVLRRLAIVEDAAEPVATRGILRPRVTIDIRFADRLDDLALLAVLEHEAQHVRARDPLRYFLVHWAVAINPIGRRLLGADLRRWIVGREAACDRAAVLRGASAPALAHALVQAARFAVASAPAVALRADDTGVLRLRVGLLLAYAERPPRPWRQGPGLRLALAGIALALLLPHGIGDGLLDGLHRATERAVALVSTR